MNPIFSDQAACAVGHPDAWFPPPGGRPDAYALKLCRQCPVRQACLDWAIEHNELGIWGGTSEKERRTIRRQRETGMNANAGRLMDAIAPVKLCTVAGCDDPATGRGWCTKHYTRWRRHGCTEGAAA